MAKRIAFTLFLFIMTTLTACAQESEESLIDFSGIYKEVSIPLGIEISSLEEPGSYIIKRIFIKESGEIQYLEWQSSYVIGMTDNPIIFDWHTGRANEYTNENPIIAYRVNKVGDRLIGVYFFPEDPDYPELEISFEKVKENS